MKVSLKWLQNYFDKSLPKAEEVADAFTFHAFEVEEVGDDYLDVDILPNRAADCLCHRGVAKELSAILDIPLKRDPLREALHNSTAKSDALSVKIEDAKKCPRYIAALVKGVKVGSSPDWLRKVLESVGQRSINNIVDATNYVMLDIGQPLHAFDAAKLSKKNDAYAISIRDAKEGEKITTLSGDNYELSPERLLITDANADTPIAIAGVKGGKVAEVTSGTTDIIIESANFDGTSVRRTAQALKLITDASLRFQNRPSPELAGYGMRDVLALITKEAGGEVAGIKDVYPAPAVPAPVSVSLTRINDLLGSDFSAKEVAGVFRRLGFGTAQKGDVFTITPPFERVDITIPEDLVEEAGRILGYDQLSAMELPIHSTQEKPNQARFRGIEKVKDFLIERGFTEISTQSFAKKGDIVLANPLDKTKPALRTTLDENMQEAMERAQYNAPLVLPPNEKPKLFEVGTVFPKDGERLEVKTSEPVLNMPTIKDDAAYEPKRYELSAFKPFSSYPFITRDIAFWVSSDTDEGFTRSFIQEQAGELLVRIDQFDRFEKEGRISLAYRLVFQSMERTLTDEEVNVIMDKITSALEKQGYEVR